MPLSLSDPAMQKSSYALAGAFGLQVFGTSPEAYLPTGYQKRRRHPKAKPVLSLSVCEGY